MRRAAESGHAAAQFIQATFAYGGTFGEDRNVTAAAEWWARAADGESPYAQLWLATLYANGEGADL